jgi:hypothetical protein
MVAAKDWSSVTNSKTKHNAPRNFLAMNFARCYVYANSLSPKARFFMSRRALEMLRGIAWTAMLVAVWMSSGEVGRSQTGSKAADPKAVPHDKPPIRIRAGWDKVWKDSKGNEWLPDQTYKEGGFENGNTIDRPELKIANTKDPDIYRAEHYSMDGFSWKLPNGKYTVKLHFAETFEGIGGPGERVFSFKIQDKEFKDFDPWVKAGGFTTAYVETVNVDVTDGKLKIVFTPKVENPQICGIEILEPEKAGEQPAKTNPASAKSSS